jgi:predicted phosphodiesterase
MITIVIGDIHGRDCWKQIAEKWSKDADEFVFIGDYFDTHDDISAAQQIHNFKEIIEWRDKMQSEGGKVILLIGNHDYHYFPEIGDHGISGYQRKAAPAISQLLDENRDKLQMAYFSEPFMFTHAGVSKVWMEKHGYLEHQPYNKAEFINDIWKHKPRSFMFDVSSSDIGYSNTGDSRGQTPIWIRPAPLQRDSREYEKEMYQIVGHTQVNEMKLTEKYAFIDCLGTSKEYLVIDNDGKEIVTLNQEKIRHRL